jgi:hypothetical protein
MAIQLPIGVAALAKLAWKPTIKLAKKLVKKYKQADDAVLKRQALSLDELLFAASGVAATPLVVKAMKKTIKEMQDTAREEKNKVPTIKPKEGPIKYRPLKGYSSPNVAKPRTRVRAHGGQVKKKPKGWGKARYKGKK